MTAAIDRTAVVQDANGHEIELVTFEAEACSPAQARHALRTLARLMLRQHREEGDLVAKVTRKLSYSSLDCGPQQSPDHGDEAA